MNLERDGAPDAGPNYECGQCESFAFIGESGCGFCKRKYAQWYDERPSIGAADVLEWVQENAVNESDDPCNGFVEY